MFAMKVIGSMSMTVMKPKQTVAVKSVCLLFKVNWSGGKSMVAIVNGCNVSH
jgi:hypothetical protein